MQDPVVPVYGNGLPAAVRRSRIDDIVSHVSELAFARCRHSGFNR